MITNELKAMATTAILNKTLKSSFFSICSIDEAAKVMGRNPHCEEYDLLRSLHCVDYSKMPRELREKIPSLVALCLGLETESPVFKPSELEIKLLATDKPAKRNAFLSWMGIGS